MLICDGVTKTRYCYDCPHGREHVYLSCDEQQYCLNDYDEKRIVECISKLEYEMKKIIKEHEEEKNMRRMRNKMVICSGVLKERCGSCRHSNEHFYEKTCDNPKCVSRGLDVKCTKTFEMIMKEIIKKHEEEIK